MDYDLIATTTFGIEAVTAKELKELGYENLKIENGKVHFQGDEMDVAISNLWLRTAERVLIKVAEFKAESFEELFNGTAKIDWSQYIPENGKMHVVGKSIKSKLFSVPDCQSIVKKAVVKSMQESYNTMWFKEDGPVYKIEVALLKDVVTLTIDTSGEGLHKRGYREHSGSAPLKETLAAALVLLSKWKNDKLLIDPFCGSGTILVEAALIGNNIAPGLKRRFVSETWPSMDKEMWDQVREGAKKSVKKTDMKLVGYDIDDWVIKTARNNAIKAGVIDNIHFKKQDFKDFTTKTENAYIICNPPYGERIGEKKQVELLNKQIGDLQRKLKGWDFNIFTAFPNFEKLMGQKSSKNRKLYNGRLLCYYYQYFHNCSK
ncbi:THUMP domain-containing class I SAM-dependent RNA methyltransferase [Clostridium tarantellae]|uniref:Class I SAM-dependent RNA methyltransferase n=1 Tax=Clostridium tarantellae TaxID=39493 RepID=A0A6I1MSW7_9CLOT|nr:class I SAM-dependent RNA methyltransferase [Clostridium tarantellae]MPQ43981.1 class I SAM-dependent RNA methyltransferase [Clostridium tarantellae]